MLFSLLSLGLTGCEELLDNSGDEKDKTENPDGGGSTEIPDDPDTSTLTPGEHQQRLEQIAQHFVAFFDPAEQQVMADALYNLSEYLSYDESMDVVPGPSPYGVRSLLERSGTLEILSSASKGSMTGALTLATRATDPDYLLTLDDYAGYEFVWNPSTEEWDEGEISGNRIRAAWDNAEVVVNWINSNQTYEIEVHEEVYVVYIPQQVEMLFQVGGQEQLYLLLQPNYADAYTIRPAVTMRLVGGFEVKVNASATRQGIGVTALMTKSGTHLLKATAEVAINDLTDTENWLEEVTDEYYGDSWTECFIGEYIYEQVKTGAFRLDILEATLCGEGNFRQLLDEFEDINDEESRDGCTLLCNLINEQVVAYLLYNDTQEKVADVKAQPMRDSYYDSWSGEYYDEYLPEPVLIFGDGSKFSIDSYFTENKFADLLDSIEELIQGYIALVD